MNFTQQTMSHITHLDHTVAQLKAHIETLIQQLETVIPEHHSDFEETMAQQFKNHRTALHEYTEQTTTFTPTTSIEYMEHAIANMIYAARFSTTETMLALTTDPNLKKIENNARNMVNKLNHNSMNPAGIITLARTKNAASSLVKELERIMNLMQILHDIEHTVEFHLSHYPEDNDYLKKPIALTKGDTNEDQNQ